MVGILYYFLFKQVERIKKNLIGGTEPKTSKRYPTVHKVSKGDKEMRRILLFLFLNFVIISLAFSWADDVVIREGAEINGLDLSLDYTDNDVLLCGFSDSRYTYQVYKSTDGGNNWVRILSISDVYRGVLVSYGQTNYFGLILYKRDANPAYLYFGKYDLSGRLVNNFIKTGSRVLAYPHAISTGTYIFVVWEEWYSTEDRDIWFAKINWSNWSIVDSQKLDGNLSTACFSNPYIDIGAWDVIVVYQNEDNGDIHTKRSTDLGYSWGSRKTVRNYNYSAWPRVAVPINGMPIVMWCYTNFSYSTNRGESWIYAGQVSTSPTPLCGLWETNGVYNVLTRNSNGYVCRYYTTDPTSTSWSSLAISDRPVDGLLAGVIKYIYQNTYRGYAAVWFANLGGNYKIYFDAEWREPASLTITSPNGGEVWFNGETKNITWSWTGNITNVKIEISTNSGSTWSTIVSSAPNNGSYSWRVNATPSIQCRIRISDVNNSSIYDISDGNFTICNKININSPNGGEIWYVGESQNINWQTSGLSGNVKIEFSTDGGSNWIILYYSTPDDGSQSVTVPNNPTTRARIKITHLTVSSNYDISDANFMVTRRIRVIVPNGGENWRVGTTQTIRWDASGLTGTNVKIELSTNGGTTFPITVTSSTEDDGEYSWTVSNNPTTQGRIRVTHLTIANNNDMSDGNFTITSIGIEEENISDFLFANTLLPNKPEPFSRYTKIRFILAKESYLSVRIFNSKGQIEREFKVYCRPGFHEIMWDGHNQKGKRSPPGVYFYHLEAGEFSAVGKIVKVE
ncbi:MAG: hypothetical protein ABIK50_04390 [candidate division WOR-3 bacterium]